MNIKNIDQLTAKLISRGLEYGWCVIVLLGVLTLLSFLLSNSFSIVNLLLILALLLIAGFAWLAANIGLRQHSALGEKHDWEFKKQQQAQLELVQAERLYLIEKAQLQPVFKATARAFITPSADQELADEVWDEDAFIAKHFSEPDLFGVKLSFKPKGNSLYSHERLIFARSKYSDDRVGSNGNEAYVAQDEKDKPVFIIPLDELPTADASKEFCVYYIYKDVTSLSVIMKYRVYRAIENDANFWSIDNQDVCFTNAYHEDLQLNSVEGCERLIKAKYVKPLSRAAATETSLNNEV